MLYIGFKKMKQIDFRKLETSMHDVLRNTLHELMQCNYEYVLQEDKSKEDQLDLLEVLSS